MITNLIEGSTLQNGKYQIIRTLGKGGFGTTYLAEQVMMKRKVCIKEFYTDELCERDESETCLTTSTQTSQNKLDLLKKQFIHEAQKIASLNHPNIIAIHDVFEENNSAYYVMEYIDGKSLSQLVKEKGKLNEDESIKYINQIATALKYLHEQKMMHLDVKPANIMVDSDDRAVLIDFGMAKHYSEAGNETISSSGFSGYSNGYAPQELYYPNGGNEFSPQIDIYSLGATFYKLLTGITPPTPDIIISDGLAPVDSHFRNETRLAISKAMEVGIKRRIKNMDEFLNILNPIENQESSEKDQIIAEEHKNTNQEKQNSFISVSNIRISHKRNSFPEKIEIECDINIKNHLNETCKLNIFATKKDGTILNCPTPLPSSKLRPSSDDTFRRNFKIEIPIRDLNLRPLKTHHIIFLLDIIANDKNYQFKSKEVEIKIGLSKFSDREKYYITI